MMLTPGWKISGWRWKTFAKHLWAKLNTDDVVNRAAILSFYLLLALFPLLLFLTALLGYFVDAGTELRRNLLTYLGGIVPVSASDLINTTVDEISQNSSGGKLWFGLLTSLWFASSGMGAIIEASCAIGTDMRPHWITALLRSPFPKGETYQPLYAKTRVTQRSCITGRFKLIPASLYR
jgi:membrane protein